MGKTSYLFNADKGKQMSQLLIAASSLWNAENMLNMDRSSCWQIEQATLDAEEVLKVSISHCTQQKQ